MTEIDLVYNLIDAFNNSNKEAEDIKMLLRTLLDRNIALNILLKLVPLS